MGQEVNTPVPISVCATRMVTVSSGAIVSQALISGTMASRYQGWPWTGAACALAGGRWKRRTMAPPTAAVEARKSRRFRSTFGVAASFAVMLGPSRLQLGRPMNGRPDARIGSAAADIGHLAVDFGIGRFRFLLEERHCRHDLPRLAVAALRNVKLDPRQLNRVRPVGRHPLDGGDGLAGGGRGGDAA